MLKRLLLLCLLTTLSSRALTVTRIDVADNVDWTLAGFSEAGSTEKYDERQLHIVGGAGLTIDKIELILDTTGTFDDSIAMDIDADGTIDFLRSQSDAYATPGIGEGPYTPWVDASPYTFDAIITTTGTTLKSYWDGVEILPNATGSSQGFFTKGGFTVADFLGVAGGIIPLNDFYSNKIRLGSLNDVGPSGHDISFNFETVLFTDSDGNTYTFTGTDLVPEPTSGLLLLAFAGVTAFARRRK